MSGDDDSARLSPKFHPCAPHVVRSGDISEASVDDRWALLSKAAQAREHLLDSVTLAQMTRYRRNIENFIGTVKVPVGLAGPLRVNGSCAQGDYYVPLATSDFAIPDCLQSQRGATIDTAIVKTIAILPEPQYSGLGGLLLSMCRSRIAELGYARAIHALIHDGNVGSRRLSDRFGKTMRGYALFARTLAPAT